MHVMAGLAPQGANEDVFVKRLQWASGLAADAGVCLCVEPLNSTDFPGYLVPNTATALRIIDRVGVPSHCKLQLDLYHYAVTEGSDQDTLANAIATLLPHTAHVQIANPPGRNEPGVGNVAFGPLLQLLDNAGYDGHVGCEYKPSTSTTEESLAWAREHGLGAGSA